MIIDVRTKEEYEAGHVDGAVNIPVDEIPTSELNGAQLCDPISVYCLSGGRAGMAKMILESRGFTNVSLHNEGRYQ